MEKIPRHVDIDYSKYAVYETLSNNAALTVKDEADPLLPMKGVKNETELAHDREAHLDRKSTRLNSSHAT